MSSEKKSGFMGYLLIPILLAVISIAWFFYPSWMGYVFTPKETVLQGDLGTLGDSFGALNTLFSGFAFAGIIVSIYFQSKELKETRKEIKAQGNQFELQTQALNKQNFESTFFQLLNLHNEIVQSTSTLTPDKRSTLQGRDALKYIYDVKFLNEKYKPEFNLTRGHYSSDRIRQYEDFFRYYEPVIGHYFRTVYQILKFIDESDITNKKFYANLLRSQTSSHELALIFYNCLSFHGRDKFKPLVERYEFFEHLIGMKAISGELLVKYNVSAFGTSNEELLKDYDFQCSKEFM